MWNLKIYYKIEIEFHPGSVAFLLFLALFSPISLALHVVTEINGDIQAIDKNLNVQSPLLVGSIIDINYSNSIKGDGYLSLFCVHNEKEFKVSAPGEILKPCQAPNELDRAYRISPTNDAPIIFFPQAGQTSNIDNIYWGSEKKGIFIIKIQEKKKDGGVKNTFESKPLKIKTRQKHYITYHYRLPSNISAALKDGRTYKLTIKNSRNGRTNEESAEPGGYYKIAKGGASNYPATKNLKKKSKADASNISNSIYFISHGEPYRALSSLEKVKNPKLSAQVDFLKANILRRSGKPFNYYASLYVNTIEEAIRSSGDVLIAGLACKALQEDVFSLNEYWKTKIRKMKNSPKTQTYCKQ